MSPESLPSDILGAQTGSYVSSLGPINMHVQYQMVTDPDSSAQHGHHGRESALSLSS